MLPQVIMTPAAVEAHGYATAPGPVVLRNASPFTRGQLAELQDIGDEFLAGAQRRDILPGTAGAVTGLAIYDSSATPSPFVLEAVLSGVALALALFVVGVSLALAAAETRDERDVLAVVGAAPAVMRTTSAQKAAILTAMSALLAVPVGFLPAVVFTAADGRDAPWLVFPWRTVLLLVVAVPLVTAAVTSLASALALRLRPVRVSTMAFE
jgi:ABC-type antimicrobial peptide transport system permease subunit